MSSQAGEGPPEGSMVANRVITEDATYKIIPSLRTPTVNPGDQIHIDIYIYSRLWEPNTK